MRVLFVTNMWPDLAAPWRGSFVRTQARSLERLGIDVTVSIIPGHRSRWAYLSAAAAAARRTGGKAFDLVHAHYGHSGLAARFELSAPLVLSYCGDDLLGSVAATGGRSRRSRMEASVFRQLARVSAATITKSTEMELCLPSSCRARNHVIPNGVDLDRFRPLAREEARRRLGWNTEEPTVLFVGDPSVPAKNFALAHAVFTRVRTRNPATRLRVLSRAPYEEVPVWMSAGDVLLFTSLSEGSPNVIKEAMAAELPIVATPVGDVPERLKGVGGCFIRPAEEDAMAEAILQTLSTGRAPAARQAVRPLSLPAVARRVIEVYEEVLTNVAPRQARV